MFIICLFLLISSLTITYYSTFSSFIKVWDLFLCADSGCQLSQKLAVVILIYRRFTVNYTFFFFYLLKRVLYIWICWIDIFTISHIIRIKHHWVWQLYITNIIVLGARLCYIFCIKYCHIYKDNTIFIYNYNNVFNIYIIILSFF